MISQLEKTFCQQLHLLNGGRELHLDTPWMSPIPRLWTSNWHWQSSACFACLSQHEANLLGKWWLHFYEAIRNRAQRGGFAPYLFDFPHIPHCHSVLSAFHIPSTAGLCASISLNSSSWKSCSSRAATRVLSWRCG